jgi:hypothetical protein
LGVITDLGDDPAGGIENVNKVLGVADSVRDSVV